MPENVIHVTGFGVFRGFTKKNPSWEAVSQLPNHIIYNEQTISIVKHEVPVTYADVDKKVQEIWSSKPKVSLFSHEIFENQITMNLNLISELFIIESFSLSFTVVLMEMLIKFALNEMHSMGIFVRLIFKANA